MAATMKPTVLITGASSGIGAATAEHLTRHGFEVFGTSRRPQAAAAPASPLGGPPSLASGSPPGRPAAWRWIAMNVCDEASVRKGLEQVLAAIPRLDALVCNAGYGIFGSVEEVSIQRAKEQFETNFFGVLRPLRAVLPGMREAGRGRIVVVGSLAGRAPIPFQAHYSATKAALDALVLALRNELYPHGVKVSLVEPGDIDTGFNEVMDWGTQAASAYGDRILRAEGVIRDSLPKAPPPEVVARAIHRALIARQPRVRYAVGAGSRLVPLGRRLLPDRLSLHLLRRHFHI